MKAKRQRKPTTSPAQRARGRRRPWHQVHDVDIVEEVEIAELEPRELADYSRR